jgi:geranylgeranyl pyrophosphate synthase
MKLDENDFEYTAKAVFVMNPSARERYETWEDLKSFMVGMAYQYMDNIASFSTSGFQLTSFKGSDAADGNYVRASVSAYTAMKYVEQIQKAKELMAM